MYLYTAPLKNVVCKANLHAGINSALSEENDEEETPDSLEARQFLKLLLMSWAIPGR